MKQCAHAMKVPWTSENVQRSTDEHLTAVCYSDMHAYCRTKLVGSYDCSYSRCYGLHASALQLTRRSRKLGAGFTGSAAHTLSLESKNAIQLTSAHAISIAPAQAEYEISYLPNQNSGNQDTTKDTTWLHFRLGFTPGRVPGLRTAPMAIPNSARDFFTELP